MTYSRTPEKKQTGLPTTKHEMSLLLQQPTVGHFLSHFHHNNSGPLHWLSPQRIDFGRQTHAAVKPPYPITDLSFLSELTDLRLLGTSAG